MYFLSKTLNFRKKKTKNKNYSGKSDKCKKKSAMLDGVTGPQQRHLHMYPIILTSSFRRHNKLSIKGKNFSKYRKVTKTLGGGGGGPTPLPPCTTVGV